MFKKLKLGAKIGLGFAALILIALALGGLAVWNMWGVTTIANSMKTESVPEVGVANNVERYSLHTMYEMRGYTYTEEPKFLTAGRKHLEEVKKYLKDAKALGDTSPNLAALKSNAEAAEKKALEYEDLVNQTVAITEKLNTDRVAMNKGAADYMKVCYEYLDDQNKLLTEELQKMAAVDTTKAGAEEGKAKTETGAVTLTEAAAVIKDRQTKINLANDIVDLGNAIRIGNWKSQTERDPKLFQETQKKFEEVNKKLDELKAITKRDVDLKRIETCRAAGKAYNDGMTEFLTNWLAREDLGKKRGAVADAVLAAAMTTSELGEKDVSTGAEHAASSLGQASTVMIIGLSIGVVIGILLAIFITRSITKPINRIIENLTNGAEQTTSAAGQVSASSQSLAQGSSEQASSLEETSSSLEEMASMTKQNAANAKQAAGLATETLEASNRGTASVKRMSDAIGQIKQSSDETARIIKVIDEIAFQTNLLALNAAVEAARAGEAGKGFAVVAEEVRNLAQRSAEAAKNTANLIDESKKNADNGVKVTEEVTTALNEIGGSIKKVTDLMAEVAAASDEQTRGIDQVNTAVGQMDQVTQQVAANAEESASASEELSAQAEQLNSMVNELMMLVGGAGSANQERTTHSPTRRATVATHATTSATHHSAGAGHSTGRKSTTAHAKEVMTSADDAAALIPLEEKEEAVLSQF